MLKVKLKLARLLSSIKMLLLFAKYMQPRESTFNGHPIKDFYNTYDFFFRFRSPKFLREHRKYFSREQRGFGEDAFHTAWFHLFTNFRPINCLEIGVYRGQIISLWVLLGKELNINVNVWGVTPLAPELDSVSNYGEMNYKDDIESHFKHFNLGKPQIIQGLSTESKVKETIESTIWDLIYIDGGHDYEVVLSDYEIAKKSSSESTIICFDDSSLNFTSDGTFKGHPGPSRVVSEIALDEMQYLFTVGHLNFFRKK